MTLGNGHFRTHPAPAAVPESGRNVGDADVRFSDNYVKLLPNEPVIIHIASKATLDNLKKQMKVISFVDAFSPSTSKN